MMRLGTEPGALRSATPALHTISFPFARLVKMRPAIIDPISLIDKLDADAIRAELDQIYEREAALRAALKVARARERTKRRTGNCRQKETNRGEMRKAAVVYGPK
jgi:hypothetical protein